VFREDLVLGKVDEPRGIGIAENDPALLVQKDDR
jgi:hypothetical protein